MGKLADYRGDNIKALATIHLSELLETSRHEKTTDEHNHQWLDENGWELRKTYLQDRNGNIYEAFLNIADGRDRKILYAVSNVRMVDKKRTAGGNVPSTENGGGLHTSHSSSEISIAESREKVNRKYSISGIDGVDEQSRSAWQGDYEDDEKARQAHRQGYPVINGVQVIPFSTYVLAQDPAGIDLDGNIFYNHNYGLVTGLGDTPGTLLISFHNKHIADERTGKTIRKNDVEISSEYLTPTPGVFQMTKEDEANLLDQAPEEFGAHEMTEDQIREIDELLNRSYQSGGTANRKEIKVEELTGKTKEIVARIQRNLVMDIADALSVPNVARRNFLNNEVEGFVKLYLEKGSVDWNEVDALFDRAYEEGVVADREFYDRYKEVKDYLRTTGVTLSERYQGDIADFNDFRQRAFNSVKIVNDGLPVDTAWMELQEMAPELFPEKIANPADQLQRMVEVAKSIKIVERKLDEFYGDDAGEFKKWAKNDINAAVSDAVAELRNVRRVMEDADRETRQVDEAEGLDEATVAELYPKLKEARREADKVMAKQLLNESDKKQVQRLLRGDIEPEHLNPARDNVRGILAVYKAKANYEQYAKQIRTWNKSRKNRLYSQAEQLLADAGEIEDKKMGILYSRETMERNIRDIVEDQEAAERIIRTYIKPVHDGAAAANKLKNNYRQRVEELKISRKVKKGDQVSEAYAVQLYGESQDIIEMMEKSKGRLRTRDGKTLAEWKEVQRQLWEENPGIDKGKVQNAVAEFRKIYDELFTQMNQVRVRNGYEPVNFRHGYFPHFQQEGQDGVMALFGKALGIDTAVTALPTTINGMTHTFKPGIRWFGNALERKSFETAYDAVEGFDRYIEGVADVICQTDNIQRLRALAQQIRYRTSDQGLKEQVDEIRGRTNLTEPERDALIKEKFENGKFELSNFVVELEEYGIAPAAYVRAQEIKLQYDADGNGSLTNKEWQAVVDAISSDNVVLGGDNTIFYMTNPQRAVLWQMLTGNKSSKSNPYSREWGEKVVRKSEEWKAAEG